MSPTCKHKQIYFNAHEILRIDENREQSLVCSIDNPNLRSLFEVQAISQD